MDSAFPTPYITPQTHKIKKKHLYGQLCACSLVGVKCLDVIRTVTMEWEKPGFCSLYSHVGGLYVLSFIHHIMLQDLVELTNSLRLTPLIQL